MRIGWLAGTALAYGTGYKLAQSKRVGRAVHVLRGKPLAYKLTFEDGVLLVRGDDTRIEYCGFYGTYSDDRPAIRVVA